MTTRKEVLTQEEIDALLSGVDSGKVVSEGERSANEALPKYDLASQDRIVRGRLPTLELVNEKFARFFRGSLYDLMRHAAEIGVGGIQIMKYSDYLNTLFVPTSINLVRVKPMTGVAMLVLDAKLVFKLVDHFFGGDGRQVKTEGRDFTPTELRIVTRVLEHLCADMKEAWKGLMPIQIEHLGVEVNPSLVNIVGPSEIMVVNVFRVELESGGGEIHFVLPYGMLEPHREQLETAGKGKTNELDRRWRPSVERRVLDARVRVSCAIAEKDLSLKDVLGFSVGDVIPIELPEQHLVYANDAPLFFAKLGTSRGSVALEFQEPFTKH